jgi:hypothetical protein
MHHAQPDAVALEPCVQVVELGRDVIAKGYPSVLAGCVKVVPMCAGRTIRGRALPMIWSW